MQFERKVRGRKAPVVGFLAARFDEAYQNAVWRGAVQEAEKLGLALVFFRGQRIDSPIGQEALDNIAFDIAKHSGMAGFIVLSNVIGTYLSEEELLGFLGRLGEANVVSVGIEFPHVPSVTIEASGGMAAIAEHLVSVHGRRRFVFVAGPKGHLESEAREAEFRASLDALAGSLGPGDAPELVGVVYGDFALEMSRDRTREFFASGARVDALVAASDLMAVGAMQAMAELGIEVPRAVSVSGFDDSEDSRFTLPPLTTVRQPAWNLGRMASLRMADRLGLPGRDRTAADGLSRVSFVIRESCGCPYAPEREEAPIDPDVDLKLALDSDEPLSALSAEVNRELRTGRNPAALRRLPFRPEIRESALLAIAEGECRYHAMRGFAAQRRTEVLGEIEASLIASFAIEDILREIARGTRELGISGVWLSLFESRGPSPEWSKLFLVSDDKGARILAPYGLRFRTSELVPGGLPDRWNAYVCEPLRFGDDKLGYLICTADSTDSHMYAALRDLVSSALKGALLMNAERDRERNLERVVRSRTLQLSTANSRLMDEMSRRKGLERELLEISNLIMGKIGQDIHDNICQDIASLGIMAALLEGKLRRAGMPDEAGEAAGLAQAAGETAARAKGIARGLYPAELEAKGIVTAVERLVAAANERRPGFVRLEVSREFDVRDSEKALHLYRIAQEALNNALRHSGAGHIRVGLYVDRESVAVEVSDDGVGMPSGARDEHGMGLHIMKYRASVIGGELRIQSKERGTTVMCRVAR